MIGATNLHKSFGDFHAVQGISFNVPPGEVLALLGPSGAGKSTTIRMLTAMLRPTSGTATVAGYDVIREPAQVRAHVGLLTEYPGLYGRMNALDYLIFFGQMQGIARTDVAVRAEALLRRFGLWEAHRRKIGSYSKGMQQKVALIRAMLHNPQVLFLDEPTSGMDPQSAQVVREAIEDLRDEQRVIVLCTHDLNEAEALADRIAVISGGKLAALGTAAELTRRLLGEPLWEIEVAEPLPGLAECVSACVTVEQAVGNRIRYRTAEPQHLNPVLLDRLHTAGVSVVALREVPRSLQDVYMQILGTPAAAVRPTFRSRPARLAMEHAQ